MQMKLTSQHGKIIDAQWVKNNYHGEEEFVIPEGYIAIMPEAFRYNSNLRKLTISKGVVEIGESAFQDCLLEQVILPDSVKAIDNWAFHGCMRLESINLPYGLYKIGENAFDNCRSLKGIFMPDSVVIIGEYLFDHCDSLYKIRLSENLQSIPSGVFKKCRSLKEVTVPEAVEAIHSYAFANCESLTSVNIKGVCQIKSCAFENCYSLKNVQIKEGMEAISEGCFRECKSLRTLNIPDSVKFIGYQAFAGCNSLEKVHIPQNLEELSPPAFDGTVIGKSTPYVEVNGVIFDVNKEYLHDVANDTLVIPEGIHCIKSGALDETENITIYFPSSLKSCNGLIESPHVHIGCDISVFEPTLTTFPSGTTIELMIEDCIPLKISLEDKWNVGENEAKLYSFLKDPSFDKFSEIKNSNYKVAIAIAYGMSQNDEYKDYQKYLRRVGDKAIVKMIEDDNFDALSFYTETKDISIKACETGIKYAIDNNYHEASILLMQYKNELKGYDKKAIKRFDL